jgi:hypothetical protein
LRYLVAEGSQREAALVRHRGSDLLPLRYRVSGVRDRGGRSATLAERLDPRKVGERVVDAIRTKMVYAFVGAVPADVIKARHRRIGDALNDTWVTITEAISRPIPRGQGGRQATFFEASRSVQFASDASRH